MKIYNGTSRKGRIIEGDVHDYHCGNRQEQMKNMTNAACKKLRHRDRREGKEMAKQVED